MGLVSGRIGLAMPSHRESRPFARAVVAPLLALALSSGHVWGMAADPTERLEAIRAQRGVPALAAYGLQWDGDAAADDGPWAVGDRAIGPGGPSGVPATAGDLWHIGSCTKAFTATLLATYVTEGKLAWDDTLAEALPGMAEDMSETAASATIADLLRHRAGMPADPTGFLMMQLRDEEAQPGREAVVLDALANAKDKPGAGEPGRYSNYGYMVAGVIAERLARESGQPKPFEALVTERVLTPLGIDQGRSGFGPPPAGDDLSAPEQPVGHMPDGDQWLAQAPGPAADNPPAYGPAGTMHLTLEAWGRFCMAHARGDDLGDGERDALGLSRADYAELHRPVASFAAGWMVVERGWAAEGDAQGLALTHNGSNTMWFATAWIAPERDWVLLATTNGMGPMAAVACNEAVGEALKEMLVAK